LPGFRVQRKAMSSDTRLSTKKIWLELKVGTLCPIHVWYYASVKKDSERSSLSLIIKINVLILTFWFIYK